MTTRATFRLLTFRYCINKRLRGRMLFSKFQIKYTFYHCQYLDRSNRKISPLPPPSQARRDLDKNSFESESRILLSHPK